MLRITTQFVEQHVHVIVKLELWGRAGEDDIINDVCGTGIHLSKPVSLASANDGLVNDAILMSNNVTLQDITL